MTAEGVVSDNALQSPVANVSTEGAVSFEPIQYSAAGTYYYEITEEVVNPSETMEYDSHPVYLKVVVNSDLSISAGYFKDKKFEETAENGAEFNNKELTQIAVKKTWNGNDNDWPEGFTVEMTLYDADNLNTPISTTAEANGNGNVNPVTLTTDKRTATWTNLPKYKKLENDSLEEIVYKVVETNVLYNGQPIESFGTYLTVTTSVTTDGTILIDNTPKTISINVTKDWKLNGNSITSPNPNSIGFKVYQVVGDDTANAKVYSPVYVTVGTATPQSTDSPTVQYDTDSQKWQVVTVSKLPAYVMTASGYAKATYYVEETTTLANTKIRYKLNEGEETETESDTATDSGMITICNRDYETDISVFKVEESSRGEATKVPLSGAKFSLSKKGTNGYTAYVDGSGKSVYESATDGKLTFTKLTDGNYLIEETDPPKGFYATEIKIYFTIENGVVTYTDENGTVITTEQPYVTYEVKSDTEPDTFIVGNTPGAALPSTGGSGTLIYTVAGIFLITLAGVLLVSRKRKNEQ